MNNVSWLEVWFGATVTTALRYLFFAGLAWFLGYVLFRRAWFHRKIIQLRPASAQMRREITHSVVTIVIFGVVGLLTLEAARRGWTQIYWRVQDHSWAWWWTSIGLTILLHDTWFYWTHRAMHHRRLFRFFHRTHHLFTNPSPWASYAFSPAEALVQAMIFPLAAMLIPIHPLAFGVFMIWQMVFNVIGHAGYEYNHRWFMKTPLRFLLSTPTNHVMHHETKRGNYGLYFNFWDRIMGTNHADYERRFMEVTSRAKTDSAKAG
jgi:Delta7-sterol 5-desaturase